MTTDSVFVTREATVDSQARSKPIKVLLLLHELSLTGAPMSVLNIFESIHSSVEVRVVCPQSGPLLDRCEKIGAVTTIEPTRLIPRGLRKLFPDVAALMVRTYIKNWRPDVIYVNSVSALNVLNRLAMHHDTPVLLHVHELEAVTKYLLRGNTNLLTRIPTRYIAVSDAVEKMLRNDYGIESMRIANIPEAIQDSFVSSTASSEISDDKRFLVGGSGRTGPRKGIDLWLLMAAELVGRLGHDKIRFQWVGARENFEAYLYSAITAKLKIEDCVEFVQVTADTAPYFRKFDLFAMTSWEDPCPLVVLETMALGVPVICFAGSGGAPEQVGDFGFVVRDFSPIKMADEIERIIYDRKRLTTMGAAAAERVKHNYTASVVGPRILEEISRLAQTK